MLLLPSDRARRCDVWRGCCCPGEDGVTNRGHQPERCRRGHENAKRGATRADERKYTADECDHTRRGCGDQVDLAAVQQLFKPRHNRRGRSREAQGENDRRSRPRTSRAGQTASVAFSR